MRFLICCSILLAYFAMPEFFLENILPVSVLLFGLAFIDFVWHLGKKLRPLDILILLAITSYLMSPALMYTLSETDWYMGFNVMVIPPEQYFRVTFPGTVAMVAGVHLPFKAVEVDHKARFAAIEAHLKDNYTAGIYLFWIGCACNLLMPFVPSVLSLVFVFGSYMIYAGGLYLYFSNHEKKLYFLIAMFLIPIVKSLRGGMFTELVYMGIFVTLMLLMKYNISFLKKAAVVSGGIVIVLFIQSIKYEFRTRTWYSVEQSGIQARVTVFQELMNDRIENPDMLFSSLVLSGMLDRTNQGSLTAMAIRYVPEYEPFAEGETIFNAIAASIVPRLLWPDKPKVGGAENMLRFTGFELTGPTSMEIGQLGDAYVNFGIWGGALFMFVYGMAFSFINSKLFELSAESSPAALLWIPIFFAGCVSVDTSILSVFGHLSKVVIFYIGLRWAFKQYLKLDI